MTDMANPETTPPSVEGDRLEAIAGVIDPEASAFIDARQSCSDEVWNEVSARYETALTKARQIAALPCKGGEAEYAEGGKIPPPPSEPKTQAQIDAHAADLKAMLDRELNALKALATPTTEPDTGRGLREALEEVATLQAALEASERDCALLSDDLDRAQLSLAALSDTPRGRDS